MIPLGSLATAILSDSRNGLPVEIIGSFEGNIYAVRSGDGTAFPLRRSELSVWSEGVECVEEAAE